MAHADCWCTMSHPTEPDDFNWAELAPNQREREEAGEELARHVRAMFIARKSTAEVMKWLVEIGLSPGEVEAFLAAYHRAESSVRWPNVVFSVPTLVDVSHALEAPEPAYDKRRERQE